MKKLIISVATTAAIAGFASVAFADPPDPTPGQINKDIKESCGTPGQNIAEAPANEFAKDRNAARKGGYFLGCLAPPPPPFPD